MANSLCCMANRRREYSHAPGMFRGVAQLASAPRLGRGGRRFKSSHPDQLRHFEPSLVFGKAFVV
jgi:hypothetical protein